jgi:multidrug efflux pump subunit AcrA (membrane-fusion protein)
MAERIRPIEQMLELSEEEAMSPEHLDSQVQKAQEQLLQLRRQAEQIEKQNRELEELSRRQEELERGRAEMTDKLSRSLVILEREGYDSQKKLEQIRATHESFTQHLQLLEAIEPKSWNSAELPKELSRALSTVDDARTEFSQQRSRLEASGGESTEMDLPDVASGSVGLGGGRSFVQWMQIGFAVTLPLIIFGIVALLVFFWLAAKVQ